MATHARKAGPDARRSTPRTLWKGAINFGLVHVPIALYPAAKSVDIDFDWLDRRSMEPVGYKRVNKETGEEVPKDDIVRGYQYEDGRYKVFVDYLRNHRGASTVAAYSARARPGLTASVPITWEELGEIKSSNQWDVVTLPGRLAGRKHDVWKEYDQTAQTIRAGMKRALGISSRQN